MTIRLKENQNKFEVLLYANKNHYYQAFKKLVRVGGKENLLYCWW